MCLGCYEMTPIQWLVSTEPRFRANADMEEKRRFDLGLPSRGAVKNARTTAKSNPDRSYTMIRHRSAPVREKLFKLMSEMPIGFAFDDKYLVDSVNIDISPNTAYKTRSAFMQETGLIERAEGPKLVAGRWVGATYRRIEKAVD